MSFPRVPLRKPSLPRCRIAWCRRALGEQTYSFGDGLGNVYRRCDAGHWTPAPPPFDPEILDGD